MADNRNPYAPPTAHVADKIDLPAPDASERFIPNGRTVSAGRGAGWIGDAWRLFKARPGKWLLSLLILIVIYAVVSWIPFGGILNAVLWPFVAAGIVAACDLQRREGNFEVDELFAGFKKSGPLLVLAGVFVLTLVVFYAVMSSMIGWTAANQLMMGAAVDPAAIGSPRNFALGMLIYLALVLPVSAAIYFAPQLILLHDLPAGTAMKMSLIGAVRNILPGIVFGLCAFLFVMASIIPLLLGLFISLPVLMITPYTTYRDVFIERD